MIRPRRTNTIRRQVTEAEYRRHHACTGRATMRDADDYRSYPCRVTRKRYTRSLSTLASMNADDDAARVYRLDSADADYRHSRLKFADGRA